MLEKKGFDKFNDTFDTLPDEAVLHIFGFFSDRTLLAAGSVDCRFRGLQKAAWEERQRLIEKHKIFEAIKGMIKNPNLWNQCLVLEEVLSDIKKPGTAAYERYQKNKDKDKECKKSLENSHIQKFFRSVQKVYGISNLFNQDKSSFRDIPELINARNEIKRIAENRGTSLQDRAAAYHLLYLLENGRFGGSISRVNGRWSEFFKNRSTPLSKSFEDHYAQKTEEAYQALLDDSNFANGPLASMAYLNLARVCTELQKKKYDIQYVRVGMMVNSDYLQKRLCYEDNIEKELNHYSKFYVEALMTSSTEALMISSTQDGFREAAKKDILAEWIGNLLGDISPFSIPPRISRGDAIKMIDKIITKNYLAPSFFDMTRIDRETLLVSVLTEKRVDYAARLADLGEDSFSQQLLEKLKLAPESVAEEDYGSERCSM